MKNILVSGASGIIGYGILRSLKKVKNGLHLIGTTIYSDSVAQGFCDIFELAPLTSDANYINWLTNIIEKHKVDLIIPGIDVDMYNWARNINRIEKTGAKVMINNLDLISLCDDKWLFYENLGKIDTPYRIDSSINSNFDELTSRFGLPFLLKPRHGFGSKGIVKVDGKDTFLKYEGDIGPQLMAQPIIGSDDEEYTTSAFCDGKGGYYTNITLRRKLSKDGFTEKAEVAAISDINTAVSILVKYFRPIGPTNFQFRQHNGVFKLLEINPRISSSTSIRTAFGYNESQMSVEYFLENKIPKQPQIKLGRAVRYVEDYIFYL